MNRGPVIDAPPPPVLRLTRKQRRSPGNLRWISNWSKLLFAQTPIVQNAMTHYSTFRPLNDSNPDSSSPNRAIIAALLRLPSVCAEDD
jgi:hypothetical protein